MKNLLLILSAFFVVIPLSAQIENVRFFDEIYDDVIVEKDVKYGKNITVLIQSDLSFPTIPDLEMDIYHASDDTSSVSPVVLVAHSGSFLPPLDGDNNAVNAETSGVKEDSSIVEMCTRLAQRGFVAIAYDYRLGWNPLLETQEERENSYINALYRAVQDSHSLLRWIQKSVIEDGNPYGLDPEKVAIMGEGTGGSIAYATATLNSIAELQSAPFYTLDDNGDPIYYIDPDISGNWDGKGYPEPADTNAVEAQPEFFIPLNYPHYIEYEGELDFAFSYGGTLLSTDWVDEFSTPMAAVQSVEDPHEPFYTSPTPQILTDEPIFPNMTGAGITIPLLNSMGVNDILNNHSYADDYSLAALNATLGLEGIESEKHLFPLKDSAPIAESAPWEWWDEDFWSEIEVNIDGENVSNMHEYALTLQPNMSPEKGKAYVDTILNFFCLRAVTAMGIDVEALIGTGINFENNRALEIKISPNPVQTEIRIDAIAGDLIEQVQIFDLSGRAVKSINSLNTEFVRIDRGDIKAGIYLIKIKSGDKFVQEKLLFD